MFVKNSFEFVQPASKCQSLIYSTLFCCICSNVTPHLKLNAHVIVLLHHKLRLTCTESVDVLIKLEADDRPVVVDDVGLTVPGAGDHLLSAVALDAIEHTDIF